MHFALYVRLKNIGFYTVWTKRKNCLFLHTKSCMIRARTPGNHVRVILESAGGPRPSHYPNVASTTMIKKKIQFFSYIRKFRRDQLQSHVWLTASSYMPNICAFPHILGSPSSWMTLHLIPSEFPYIWGNFFFFYQCTLRHRVLAPSTPFLYCSEGR